MILIDYHPQLSRYRFISNPHKQYDRVSDVVENGVSFWSDFQSGSRVLKNGVIDLFLCIAMAYNVFPCTEIIRNTEKEKVADFTM